MPSKALLLTCAGFWVGSVAHGQILWNGSHNDRWSSKQNWTPDEVPTTSDSILFDDTYVITSQIIDLRADRTVNGVLGFDGSISYTLTNNVLTLGNNVSNNASANMTIASAVVLSGDRVFQMDGTGDFLVQGDISGTAILTKEGVGLLTLNSSNSFTGGLILNAGTIRIGHNEAVGTGTFIVNGGTISAINGARIVSVPLSIGANFAIGGTNNLTLSGAINMGSGSRTITINNSGETAFSGIVSGTGSFIKNGTGTLRLSGTSANTFSGTIVNAGTLLLSKTAGVNAIIGSVTIGDGTGGIASDVLRLGAANQISDTSAITIGSSGQLDLAGFNETVQSISGSSTNSRIALGAGTLTLNETGENTFAGQISGSGNLVKQSAGKLILSGTNSYTGTTTVSAGVINISHGNALGTSAGGTTISSGAALELQGGITVSAEALTLNGTGISSSGALRNTSGNNVWGGTITLAGQTQIQSDSGTLTLNGAISGAGQNLIISGAGNMAIGGVIGTGTGSVTKDSTGTLTLSGANSYTGATIINAGTLLLGANNVLADSSSMELNGAQLNLGGIYSDQIGALTFSGGIIDFGTPGSANYFLFSSEGSASGILTVQNWEENSDRFAFLSSATLSAAFTNGLFFSGYGAGALFSAPNQTVAGYGSTWTFLLPNTNFITWDGGHASFDTWSKGGNWNNNNPPSSGTTLKIAFDGNLRLSPDLDSDYTVNTLRFNSTASSFNLISSTGNILTFGGIRPGIIQRSSNNQTISHAVKFDATTLFEMTGTGSLTLNGVVSGVGGLEKIGAGTLVLGGTNSYQGVTTIEVGVARLRNSNALGATSAGTTVQFGASLELENNISIGNESLTLSGPGVGSVGALRNISGTNSWAGTVTLGAAATISSDSGLLTMNGNVVNAGFGLTAGGSGNVTVASIISGTGSLTKTGNGVLTLSGASANTFSGGTIINAGTLELNKSSGVNALTGSISIGDGAGGIGVDSLKLIASHQIADTSALTLSASGKFDLNNFTETVSSLASSSSDSRVALGGSGTGSLTVGGTDSTTFAGIISGAGSLTKQGSGTLSLTGANTFDGTTTIGAGALRIQNALALGATTSGTVVNAGALEILGGVSVGNESLTLNGTGISSSGALRNISGDNSFSGAITLGSATRINSDAGILTLSGNIGGSTQALTIGGAGEVLLSGALSTGTGTLTKDGAGTLTMTASNSHSGGTILNNGTIALGHNNAMGSGSLTLSGGNLTASGASRTIANTTILQGNAAIGGSQALQLSGQWTQSGGNRTLTIDNDALTTFSGGINLSENNTGRTLTLAVDGGDVAINSVISNGGTGAGGLTKTGAGTLILGGNNTFTGTTTINAGLVSISASERLNDSSSLSINGGTLNLDGLYTERVGSLTFNNGILDFGTTGTANHLLFNGEGTTPTNPLIVFNWQEGIDRFGFQSSNTLSQAFLNNIYFAGFGSIASLSSANQTVSGYGSTWTFLLPTVQFYDTWDGGDNSKDEWSRNANWVDGSAPIGGVTTRVAFDGNTRLTPDLNSDFTVNSLRFDTNAGSFNIGSIDDRLLTFGGIVPTIMQRSANNQIINTRLSLGAVTLIDATGAGTLTLANTISGAGITKIGNGTLILSSNNTFTGAVNIYGGTVSARHSNALGTTAGGTLVASGATLELQNGISIGAEALTLNGTGVSNVGALRNASGNNSVSGNILLGSSTLIQADSGTTMTLSGNISGSGQALTVGGTGNVTLSGVLQTDSGTVTKTGSGTLTLSGAQANTFSGSTTVNEGVLLLSKTSGNAIVGSLVVGDGVGGAAADIVRLNAANQIDDSASLTLNSSGRFDLNNFDEQIGALSSSSSTAQVVLGNGALTVGGLTSTTFAGVVSGNGALNRNGSGTLTLSGTNTYAGQTTISGGTLNLQNASALGGTTAGTTVNTGGALSLEGGITVTGESLTLNGSGVGGSGALRNVAGINTWTGAISLSSASTVASDSGQLNVNGTVANNGNQLSVIGAGDVTINGAVAGSGALNKSGVGTLTLAANNTFTGEITISEGTLLLAADNRIADAASMTLSGGTFNTGGFDETLGPLTLAAGSAIDLGAGDSVLQFANSSGSIWNSGSLVILNWNGTTNGTGADQIYFGDSASGLSAGQLGQIFFVNPAGFTAGTYFSDQLVNGQLVPRPVPEPATILAVFLVSGIVFYRERKIIFKLATKFRQLRF